MAKKLTLTAVNKNHAKEFNEKFKLILSTGDYLYIQTKFKTTSIQQMLIDYTEILGEIKKKDVKFDLIKDATFVYYMLLIRHFTDLDNIPNDIEKMVIVCEELINLGFLEEILAAFPQTELEKVQKMIEKVSENGKLIGNQIGEIFAKEAINGVLKGDDEDGIQQPE